MYQVWTKEEYQDGWTRNDCQDLDEARQTIIQAARTGREPLLTQEVPFTIEVKVMLPEEAAPRLHQEKEPDKEGKDALGAIFRHQLKAESKEPAKEELKEEQKVEADQSGSEENKGPRGKSQKPVR